jgi:hypothetical protein
MALVASEKESHLLTFHLDILCFIIQHFIHRSYFDFEPFILLAALEAATLTGLSVVHHQLHHPVHQVLKSEIHSLNQ